MAVILLNADKLCTRQTINAVFNGENTRIEHYDTLFSDGDKLYLMLACFYKKLQSQHFPKKLFAIMSFCVKIGA